MGDGKLHMCNILIRTFKERDHMGDQRVDVSFIKYVLKIGCKGLEWIHLAHDRFQWRDVINLVMKLWLT